MSKNHLSIDFEEYDLDNGLHVILHKDNTSPLVSISVMYHVGSKNESPDRTGFAHFFEHLLFEGSENIARGQFFNIVQNAGGTLNANTSYDRTFYYEVFPSHQLETGLWLESERMLHATVDETGIETQRSVVKEERRQRYDNRPYGRIVEESMQRAYTVHPYRWPVIGSMDHIDAASEEDYRNFYARYYVPQNAALCIAGDIDTDNAKGLIQKYFGTIPKGELPINRPEPNEPPMAHELRDIVYDNIQLPAVIHLYHIPAFAKGDYFAVKLLSDLLSTGQSSRLNKVLVDEKRIAVQVGSFPLELEHPGVVLQFAIGNPDTEPEVLESAMDEIDLILKEGLADEDFEKLINQTETKLVNEQSTLLSIAEGLSTYYTYFGDTSMFNKQMDFYRSVKKEDIRQAALKYFNKDNRVALFWLPEAHKIEKVEYRKR